MYVVPGNYGFWSELQDLIYWMLCDDDPKMVSGAVALLMQISRPNIYASVRPRPKIMGMMLSLGPS